MPQLSISGIFRGGLAGVQVDLIDSGTNNRVDATNTDKNGNWEFPRPGVGTYNIEFSGRGANPSDYIFGIEIIDGEGSEQFLNDTPPSGVFGDAGTPIDNFTNRLESRVEVEWAYTQDAVNFAHGFIVRWEHGSSSGQAVTTASPSRKLDSTIRKTTIEIPADDFITIKVYAYFAGKSGSNEDAGYQHASWVDSQPVVLASLSGWDSETAFLQGGAAKLHSDGYLELGTAIGNYAKIDASHATYRMWIGHTDPTLATFSVEKDGTFHALAGDIASWDIGTGKLVGGNVVGEYTGLQSGAGATRTFFAGADDNAGTDANAYITASGEAFFNNITLSGSVSVAGYLPLSGGTMDNGAILRIDSIYARDADGLTLADDAGNLGVFIKDGGDVGIGTDSPGAYLDIDVIAEPGMIIQSDTVAPTIRWVDGADSDYFQWRMHRGNDYLILQSNTTDILTAFKGGGISVGTDSSRALLTIADQQDIGSQTYSAGWAGSGWDLDYVNSEYVLELDSLFVRGPMYVYDLIINQLSAQNGGLIVSAGNGRVESVTGSPSTEQITFQDPEGTGISQFAPGDILLIQNVNLDSTTLVKRIVRKVELTSGMTVICQPLGDAPTDAGSIAAGDVIVVIGNTKGGSASVNVLSDAQYAGTGGWTGGLATITLSYDSGDVGHTTTVRIEADSTGSAHARGGSLTFVTGKDYIVEFDFKTISLSGSTHSFRFVDGGTPKGGFIFAESSTWAHVRKVFTESDLSAGLFGDIDRFDITLQPAGGLATDEMLIDNISVRVAGTVRDAMVFISSTDAYGPYTMIMDEVDSWAAWKDPSKIKAVMGNLENKYGYDTEVYGFAAGSVDEQYITVDPTNGIRIIDGSEDRVLFQASGDILTVGEHFIYTSSTQILTVAGWTTTVSTFEKLDGSNTGVKLDADNSKIQVGNLDEQHIDLLGADGSVVWYKSDGGGGATEVLRIDDNIPMPDPISDIVLTYPGIQLVSDGRIQWGSGTGSVTQVLDGAFRVLRGVGSPPGNDILAGIGEDGSSNGFMQLLENSSATNLLRFDWGGSAWDLHVSPLGSGSGTDLIIDSSGFILKKSSSIRYKKNVEPMEIDSSLIYDLDSVSFNWKDSGERDFGFIAEKVDNILPCLTTRNDKDEVEAVKYDKLSVLLLNEVKKLREEINVLKSIN